MEQLSEQIRQAAMKRRANQGLRVVNLDSGWEGYFANEASRDEFVARARRLGERVEVVS